jgi:hypothetical protein
MTLQVRVQTVVVQYHVLYDTFALTQLSFHAKTGATAGAGFTSGFSPCNRRHDAATVAAVAAADAMRYPYWPDGKQSQRVVCAVL